MKKHFLVSVLLFCTALIYSQDTTYYSNDDLSRIRKSVKEKDASSEIQNMISKSWEIEERFQEIRKSYSDKMSDSTSKAEFTELSKTYYDSVLISLNLTKDSVKTFREDFTIAEQLINKKFGPPNKQVYFLLYEKILPSLCRYLKEFQDRYNHMFKVYFDCDGCFVR